jgi:pyridoxamine 5'-phosphate oxidase
MAHSYGRVTWWPRVPTIHSYPSGSRPANGPWAGGPTRPIWNNGTVSSPADPISLRWSYESGQLSEDGLAGSWREQLQSWYDQAAADPRITDPNAMQLATADEAGLPDVRTVLARGFDSSGVVFYTGHDSAKGRQLAANPNAAAVFSWLPLERQIRLRGSVHQVDQAQTEAYFAGRPRGSQLAAWASPQSHPLTGRAELDALYAAVTERFAGGAIPVPPGWGGYRIVVREMEFWQGRQFRLHDRLRFRQGSDGDWTVERLAP